MAKIARVQTLVVRDGFGGDGAKERIPLCVRRPPNRGGKKSAGLRSGCHVVPFSLRALDRRDFFFAELGEGFALFC
jgi:hypothetical protein